MSGYTEEFKLKIVKEHLKEGYSSRMDKAVRNIWFLYPTNTALHYRI